MTRSPPRGGGSRAPPLAGSGEDPPQQQGQRERRPRPGAGRPPSPGGFVAGVDVTEQRRLHLEALEGRRDSHRRLVAEKWGEIKALQGRVEALQGRVKALQGEMKALESSLMEMDDDIDRLQEEIDDPPPPTPRGGDDQVLEARAAAAASEEEASGGEPEAGSREPTAAPAPARRAPIKFVPFTAATQADERLDDPSQDDEEGEGGEDDDEEDEEQLEFVDGGDEFDADDEDFRPSKRRAVAGAAAAGASEGSERPRPALRAGPLDCRTALGGAPASAAGGVPRGASWDEDSDSENRQRGNANPASDFSVPRGNASRAAGKDGNTIESAARAPPMHQRPPPRQQQQIMAPSFDSLASSSARSDQHQQPPPQQQHPWSDAVHRLLREPFRLPSFRDSQPGVIDATLSGSDAFVVMRTGGGKSLTYQLPALLEGRSPPHKVTFVVSPLLSLIQDQEEQMNEIAPGSAVSFSSSIGTTEHARRWGLVRDPSSGVCLVFVTPEKVSQSKKMQTEMEKLYNQGRLGRFVVDECHCASQWGHDFRPDYTKLGLLKRHFPRVPCIAVTATASDKVRDDVTEILCLDRNYRFFRSSANRPNLRYGVRTKRDGGKDVVQDMVAFVKDRHPRDAGIVYTFSRKDADTVASQLCEHGVVARSYHSDVPAKTKERIHRSWMRNETQVVVATIAFGLGINKPDVRFVLHHSLSKTLDAYYQESGRAGRDGNPADCVLYYSPKDVPRMLKMVHGTKGESLLWPMVRYAQASGDDAVCRAILMRHLGEPVVEDLETLLRRSDGSHTERRDVGRHCQTAAKLLAQKTEQGEKITMPMLIKEWRSKSKSSPQCVLDYPPSKDGLTADDCERIIISLLLESVVEPKIVWGAYDSIVYLELGRRGWDLVQSTNPTVCIRFPIVDDSKPSAQETKKRSRKTVTDDSGWVTSKPKKSTASSRKTKSGSGTKRPPKAKTVRVSTSSKPGRVKKPPKKAAEPEVIDILSSDDDADDPPLRPRKPASGSEARDDMFDSTSEEELD